MVTGPSASLVGPVAPPLPFLGRWFRIRSEVSESFTSYSFCFFFPRPRTFSFGRRDTSDVYASGHHFWGSTVLALFMNKHITNHNNTRSSTTLLDPLTRIGALACCLDLSRISTAAIRSIDSSHSYCCIFPPSTPLTAPAASFLIPPMDSSKRRIRILLH